MQSSPLLADGRSQNRMLGAVKSSRLRVKSSAGLGNLDAGLMVLAGKDMRFFVAGTSSETSKGELGLCLGVLWERTLALADFVAAM